MREKNQIRFFHFTKKNHSIHRSIVATTIRKEWFHIVFTFHIVEHNTPCGTEDIPQIPQFNFVECLSIHRFTFLGNIGIGKIIISIEISHHNVKGKLF